LGKKSGIISYNGGGLKGDKREVHREKLLCRKKLIWEGKKKTKNNILVKGIMVGFGKLGS